MVDREALKQYANDKKASYAFIARSLHITSNGFNKKLQGKSDFKAQELKVMSDVLQMSVEDRERIFFAENV